jgi:tetratricopeptide (TPR) repeat protein
LYRDQGRHAEAEPLHKRALAIREKALGPEHPHVATSLDNLAVVYRSQGRIAEAEPLIKRALAIREKALGPEHPDVGVSLNHLAMMYKQQQRYAEAEPLYERALAIVGKAFGPEHPDVATVLDNLATIYQVQGRYAEAEPLHKRALAIREKALGPEHPGVALSLTNLAALHAAEGRYGEALDSSRRAMAIFRTRFVAGESESELQTRKGAFVNHLLILHAAMITQRQALMDEALEAIQLSRASSVATVVAQMATRFAAGDDALAAVVRERQDAAVRWRALDARLIAAMAETPERRNPQLEAADRKALKELEATLQRLDERLAREFPAYAEVSSPRPLALDELQSLLAPDEALLAFAVWTDRTFLFAVRRDGAALIQLQIGADALRAAVEELRASLTPQGIRSAGQLRERGFPAARAYELYAKLFALAEEIL